MAGTPDLYKLQATGAADAAWVGRKTQTGTLAGGGAAPVAFAGVGSQTGTLAAAGAAVAAWAGGQRQAGALALGGAGAAAFAGGRTQTGTFALGGAGGGAFAGTGVQAGTWAATGTGVAAWGGFATAESVGHLQAAGGAAGAFAGGGVQRGTLAALAAAAPGFVGLAGGTGPITVFVPYSDIPCAACCLTPDVLCFRVVGCNGTVHTGRLRRIPPTSNTDFRWDTCTGGSVRVQLNCSYLTGMTSVIVSDGFGGGGPIAAKVPDRFCGGYHIAWSHPADSMPVFRCGPGDNQTVALVEITDVATGECAACLDGIGGIAAKTITAETGLPCPTVCSCCALVPCRQCLVLSIDAPGCDFSGMSVVLESPDGGCTWAGTLQPDTHLPSPELNCTGEIAASATCAGGGWAISFGTPDLLGCGTPTTTRAQCDPLVQVLARLVCTGEEE